MLKDKSDEFYGARLVADARLHLGAVVNDQSADAFFVTMCKIIDRKVYLGYKAFNGKEVELKGVKDFIFNSWYGLGIKKATLSTFLANCARAAVKDKSQGQYAARVVKWLGEEYDGFNFPQEYFEFIRIKAEIKNKYGDKSKKRPVAKYWACRLYNQYPEMLHDIGVGRKYEDDFASAEYLTLRGRKEALKPLALYKNPTTLQVQQIAENLSERLGMDKRRVLIASMIEIYKRDKLLYEHSPADDI